MRVDRQDAERRVFERTVDWTRSVGGMREEEEMDHFPHQPGSAPAQRLDYFASGI
jgi:hypothetical protein